jgi:hypothetical protein
MKMTKNTKNFIKKSMGNKCFYCTFPHLKSDGGIHKQPDGTMAHNECYEDAQKLLKPRWSAIMELDNISKELKRIDKALKAIKFFN